MRKMEYEELEQILNERKDNEKLELRDLEFDLSYHTHAYRLPTSQHFEVLIFKMLRCGEPVCVGVI